MVPLARNARQMSNRWILLTGGLGKKLCLQKEGRLESQEIPSIMGNADLSGAETGSDPEEKEI